MHESSKRLHVPVIARQPGEASIGDVSHEDGLAAGLECVRERPEVVG